MSLFGRWFGKGTADGRTQPSADAQPQPAAEPQIDLQQVLQEAVAHHNAGRAPQAERLYERILAASPGEFNALHLLGVLYHQRGEHERAAGSIRRAIESNPHDAAAHSNLGECLRALRRNDEARACYEQAAALAPQWAAPHFNLGNLHRTRGDLAAARVSYERALELQPDMMVARYELARACEDLGDAMNAKVHYESVPPAQPQYKLARFALGNLARMQADRAAAQQHYRAALAADPALVPALINLGSLLSEDGALDEAHTLLQRALAVAPMSFEAQLGLGEVLRLQQQFDAATQAFEAAARLRPESSQPWVALGNIHVEQGEHQRARQAYARGVAANPADADVRWRHAVAALPAMRDSAAEAEQARAAFAADVRALDAFLTPAHASRAHEIVGVLQPFLLAYGEAPNRDLLKPYGAICTRLMGAWQNARALPPRASTPSAKFRVGFVSAHVSDHSVWTAITKGFVTHLDRSRFTVEVFYLGGKVDAETRYAMQTADYFEQGVKPLDQWALRIAERQLDALIYPEIGMDATTLRLAAMRLAPAQAASWGHPETTGLTTMDAYLSAHLLEPPDGASGYIERLVALPNLGCHIACETVTDADPGLRELGLDDAVPLLLCPGVPFKYAPEHDGVFVEIARRLGCCQFVFFTHRLAGLSAKLRARLEHAFAAAGLDAILFV